MADNENPVDVAKASVAQVWEKLGLTLPEAEAIVATIRSEMDARFEDNTATHNAIIETVAGLSKKLDAILAAVTKAPKGAGEVR